MLSYGLFSLHKRLLVQYSTVQYSISWIVIFSFHEFILHTSEKPHLCIFQLPLSCFWQRPCFWSVYQGCPHVALKNSKPFCCWNVFVCLTILPNTTFLINFICYKLIFFRQYLYLCFRQFVQYLRTLLNINACLYFSLCVYYSFQITNKWRQFCVLITAMIIISIFANIVQNHVNLVFCECLCSKIHCMTFSDQRFVKGASIC